MSSTKGAYFHARLLYTPEVSCIFNCTNVIKMHTHRNTMCWLFIHRLCWWRQAARGHFVIYSKTSHCPLGQSCPPVSEGLEKLQNWDRYAGKWSAIKFSRCLAYFNSAACTSPGYGGIIKDVQEHPVIQPQAQMVAAGMQ